MKNHSDQKPRKGRIFMICLVSSLLVGLLIGASTLLTMNSIRNGSPDGSSFSLSEQGYSGNSFQKLVSPVQADPTIADTCERVQSSVITILVSVTKNGQAGQGLGSGFIFREADGHYYIMTNAHVVADAEEIYLYTSDGELVEMQLIGADTQSDVAVVSLDLSKLSDKLRSQLTIAELGDSDAIRSGQTVIAIGSPHAVAYQNSVTVGVISYPKREITLIDTPNSYIQIDAAINPGNSGGALFNSDGQVIGINSNKIALDDVEGIGFAIPINHAQEIAETLMQNGSIQRLSLGGIDQSTFLPESLANLYHVPTGLVVYGYRTGSSAEQQGLKSGDIITEIDGQPLDSMETFNQILLDHKAGDTVTVTVIRSRNTADPLTLQLTLEPSETDETSGGFWGTQFK